MSLDLSTVATMNIRWWDKSCDEKDVHTLLIAHQRYLATRTTQWERMDRFHATLYADMPVTGLGPFAYMNLGLEEESSRLNLIKACVDSAVAAAAKNFPKPQTITEKGDWALKRRGEGMNRWLAATFEAQNVPNDLAPYVGRITNIHGTGIAKVWEDVPGGKNWDEAKVAISAAFPWDFTFVEPEAQDPRNIRTLYYQQWYDLDVLAEMFPGHAEEIVRAGRNGDTRDSDGPMATNQAPNLVKVIEGYRLRSSRTAKDGSRAVCIPGCTLLRVPYERDEFPFAVLRRAKAPMGWRGIGIPQELKGRQMFLNETMLALEEAIVFFARPKWMVPRGSSVQRAHLDDRIGSIVEFDGPVAPVMYVPNVVMPPQQIEMMQWQWQNGFESLGISSLFAGGQVPPGLKSGEAIRRYTDEGQARAVETLKLQEQWVVDLANLCVESGRTIAKENPKFCSQYDGGRRTELVYFAKVDPKERDRYKFKVFPTNQLAGTLSDKIEQLDLLANHNPPLIDEHTYRLLLDWTDMDQENSLANAPFEILDAIVSKACDSDDPLAIVTDARNVPDPDWPLDYMKARCQFHKARAFLDEAPVGLLDALGTYIDLIQNTIDNAAPKPPLAAPRPGAGPMPGPPMGAPVQQGAPATVAPGTPMPQAA